MPDNTERLVERLVRGLPDAAVLLDSDFHPLHYNAAYLRLVGLKRRELRERLAAGASAFDLITSGGEDAQKARESLETGLPSVFAEVQVRTAARQELTAWLIFVPVDATDGQGPRLLQIVRDVTAEQRLQTHFKRLLALSNTRAEAQERLVAQRTKELTLALEEVTRMSRTEPLTGLLNRRAFTEVAEKALSAAQRHERGLALVMCDLDHFKRINDTFGHSAGDSVLRACAKSLRSSIREIDCIARFGGEEFVILLTETRRQCVLEAANRCRVAIENAQLDHTLVRNDTIQTASFGVAVHPEHGTTLDELFSAADSALYRAKEKGRNQCVLYNSTMMHQVVAATTARDRLRMLLVDGDPQRVKGQLATFADEYDVELAESAAEGAARCQRQSYDVIVAHDDLEDHCGLAFLSDTVRHRPGALRILLVDSEIRMTQPGMIARVDCVLRRDDLKSLRMAIQDGLEWREVQRRSVVGGDFRLGGSFRVSDATLDTIIRRGEFTILYQPIVTAADRRVCGHEALCRPELAGLNAVDLFASAVRAGRTWDLGRAIRIKTMEAMGALDASHLLFINAHPAEFDDPRFLVGEAQLAQFAKRIVVEITERTSLLNHAHVQSEVNRLRGFGFRFAIDDLGAGYASLNSLALLRPQFIKIDMEIVRDIDRSPTRSRLVKRIVDFANDENVQVVAEGIESEQEAVACTEIGCHLLQGFYFGKPSPLSS